MANDEICGLAHNSPCAAVIHLQFGTQRDQRPHYRIVQIRSLYVVMVRKYKRLVKICSIYGNLC